MCNVLTIARKEFIDLLSNRVVLVVLIAFSILVILAVCDFNFTVNGGHPGAKVMFYPNIGLAANNYIFYTLSWYGTVIGIIIGCSTISSERAGRALNTLIVKPVYRDTVINGKLLGSILFLACIMMFFIAIYTSGFFVLCGSAIAPFLVDYFERLPFVFLFIMVFVGAFLSVSVLISLLVRDQAFAMILSTFTVYVSMITYLPDVASNVNYIIPGYSLDSLFLSISPGRIIQNAQVSLMNTSLDAVSAFINVMPYLERMLLYAVVGLVLSYIVFVRSDIS